jgi:predicted ester cyclase
MATVYTDPKILAARWVDVFSSHRDKELKTLLAPQARFTAPAGVRLQGNEKIAGYFTGWLNAFPDARVTIQNSIVSGPWAVVEYTIEGTHRGTLATAMGDIAPTNKTFVGHGVKLLKCENDLIVDYRLYFDIVEMLTQLGIMPVASKN